MVNNYVEDNLLSGIHEGQLNKNFHQETCELNINEVHIIVAGSDCFPNLMLLVIHFRIWKTTQ